MSPAQPSKDKRAARNRQRRAALEARRAAARGEAAAAASSGGEKRRPTSARAALQEARAMQPPGYRAAMSALIAAVAVVILSFFVLKTPVDRDGDLYSSYTLLADWTTSAIDAATADPSLDAAGIAEAVEEWTPGRDEKSMAVALMPWSLAIFLPVIGAGIAFWAVRRRAGSRVVNRALYATLFGAILSMNFMILFIPVLLGIGIAMFQIRKAEMAEAMVNRPAGGDDVIDLDEVDAEELGEDVLEDEEALAAEEEAVAEAEAEAIEVDVVADDEPKD